ncbi:GGDEF domain-containing protein [Rhodobacteraceae bacterium RKSG542]|uniref:GGDEF domain-containing protein n=1 Tax=Pseudovibrio flavus TaxID=2529854 RepID=UPI0012BB74AB|nr:GGDEF domain-containing protein [Pseudovibrio flavus]MTI15786.1 GGDEF domain-containing protein [Pseudovibrio flavus]
MAEKNDYQRTLDYAERALDYIKACHLPAFPRNYELWYSYVSGFNLSLNRAINKLLTSEGKLDAEQASKIYNRFLSPDRLGERIDEVGSKISEEVSDLVKVLDKGSVDTAEYARDLTNALEKLRLDQSPEQLNQLVMDLLRVTTRTADNNQELRTQLAESRNQIKTLQEGLEAIRYESHTDELTTLHNRRHFDQSIEREIKYARDSYSPLCLLITDIDHFKQFNDNYGHQTGDQVLRLVALATKQNVSSHDIACRYGGEEFAVILPRTKLSQAEDIAEKIRRSVISKELVKRSTGENLGRITISIGVAELHDEDSSQTLIARADTALYAAKGAGRNLVKTERELEAAKEQATQVA